MLVGFKILNGGCTINIGLLTASKPIYFYSRPVLQVYHAGISCSKLICKMSCFKNVLNIAFKCYLSTTWMLVFKVVILLDDIRWYRCLRKPNATCRCAYMKILILVLIPLSSPCSLLVEEQRALGWSQEGLVLCSELSDLGQISITSLLQFLLDT